MAYYCGCIRLGFCDVDAIARLLYDFRWLLNVGECLCGLRGNDNLSIVSGKFCVVLGYVEEINLCEFGVF